MGDSTPDSASIQSSSDFKTCPLCKITFPNTAEFFHHNGKLGLHNYCKECRKAIQRGYLVVIDPFKCRGTGFKRCSTCKECKPATREFFGPDARRKDGFQSTCRVCYSEQSRNRRRLNPDKGRERSRLYREQNPDKVKAMLHRWYEEHSDYAREKAKQWEQNNPERVRERRNLWRTSNADKYAANNKASKMRRRSREFSVPYDFSPEDWERALSYFDGQCAVCGKKADELLILAQDHWIPISKGGATTAINIIPLCQSKPGSPAGLMSCNLTKSNKNPEKWLVERYGRERAEEILRRIEAYFEWVRQQDKS